MRTTLAAFTLLAGSVVGAAGTVAPAQAATCTPPNVSGYVVTGLHAEGLSCGDARELATRVVPRGELAQYDCTRRHHDHRTATTCVHRGSHGHQYFTVAFHSV
jgi:hypothetical protein